MDTRRSYMPAARVILPVFLSLLFCGCKDVGEQQKALVSEAHTLVRRDTDVTHQWTNIFVKVFTTDNRDKFPSNRDFFRTHAEEIIKLVDESSRLNNGAADKYEQAAALSSNEQQRRGMQSFASSFRKSAEAAGMVKSQMQMVSDQTVVDAKSFNQKLEQSWRLIVQKQRESEADMKEGRRLLGW